MRFKWLGVLPGFFCVVGCLTSSDKKELQDELFTARTKILALETQLQASGQRGASSSVQIDSMQTDLQRMQGELDLLRIGIKNGRLPGGKEDEPSIATTLEDLQQKIEALEKAQGEMLKALSKVKSSRGSDKKATKGDSGSKEKLKTSESFETAFKEKKYSAIAEEAPGLLKKKQLKHGDRVHYLYAESLFKLGQLEEAALEFDKLLKIPSLSASYPKIQLRLGDCFRRLGDKATALLYYGELTAKSPNTPEATSAEEQMKKLKK